MTDPDNADYKCLRCGTPMGLIYWVTRCRHCGYRNRLRSWAVGSRR